ncbi:MAG: 30S ribosomal protein S6 [Ruminococcaceae bacterium]|nr:30S ribosomal protein S6 [Oscillospiraceae bacterium]
MEKKIGSYETLFVVSGNLAEDAYVALKDKFVALIESNASDVVVNEWGKRRLAYPINYITEGYYVLANFKSEPDFPHELTRVFGITEGILRYMTVAKEVKAASAEAEEVSVEEVAESTEATEE